MSPAFDAILLPPAEPRAEYLATILDYDLYWNDSDGCPYWPEGEPLSYNFDTDGGITQEPMCDVHRLPGFVRSGKLLDCGHRIDAGSLYITWIGVDQDSCLGCAAAANIQED